MNDRLRRSVRRDRGASVVEFSLLLVAIAAVAALAVYVVTATLNYEEAPRACESTSQPSEC
jgi:Flp pilus assembly pilin Flp